MSHTLSLPIEVSDQFLYDVLTTAAEGGIGYWANYRLDRAENLSVTRIYDISDREADEGDPPYEQTEVRPADLLVAIQRVATESVALSARWREHVIQAVAAGDDGVCDLDADDCDCLVQIALFGTTVYG